LALFVPLIISSGGNSGSQAATLIIRAMALGEIALKDWATGGGGGLFNKKVQTARSVRELVELVDKTHAQLSIRRQCKLLGVARSSVEYEAVAESDKDLNTKLLLDKIYMIDPCLGSRRLVLVLHRDHGVTVGRKHLQRLRREPTGGTGPISDTHSLLRATKVGVCRQRGVRAGSLVVW
jgi:hypothetical protein